MSQTLYPRIASLDGLRGLGILLILLMNIQAFAFPEAVYLNPTAYGEFSGVNYLVWLFTHLLVDTKAISLLCILFGAGVLLYCERIEASGNASFLPHYKRMLVLLLFGACHGYFIWYGDILFNYALCGMLVFWCRSLRAGKLWQLSIVLLVTGAILNLLPQFALDTLGAKELDQINVAWAPDHTIIDREINSVTGSWLSQFERRAALAYSIQTQGFLFFSLWHNTAMMLIGMALFKHRLFLITDKIIPIAGALLIMLGMLITFVGVNYNNAHHWQVEYSLFFGRQFNYFGAIFQSIGYVLLGQFLIQNFRDSIAVQILSKVGKTALSNYILQSLISTTIFYGFGFSLFAQLSRTEALPVVVLVWFLNLLLTVLWLNHFKQGPLEKLWRALVKI